MQRLGLIVVQRMHSCLSLRAQRVGLAALCLLVLFVTSTASAGTKQAQEAPVVKANAAIGEPRFRGLAHPVPESGVAFAPDGQLARIFAADVARGAGQVPGNDFWVDRMLVREGTGGGFDDENNWLFTRGRAAYLSSHVPEQPGFVGQVAYWHATDYDALFHLQSTQGTREVQWNEQPQQRRQTPSYFSTVFEDAGAGVRMRLVKYITEQNVAVATFVLSSLDGAPHTLSVQARSPMATHADGAALTGAFDAYNAITTVFPRLSGDGFRVDGARLVREVAVPATGEAAPIKVQLGLLTHELPEAQAEYDRIAGQSPQQAYQQHVARYNRWWVDNVPYLDTPNANITKSLFYRWWVLRFNFLDANVPGNDYQFPVAIEGVLGYNNAIVLTTGMFLDDLKYLRDPIYAYGSWLSAGETAGGGKYVDNPGSPENWSNSYAQSITAAAWRSLQVHGGPPALASKLARYGSGDVDGVLAAYDLNHNGLIEYDWAAMTGNDADAVSFDWAKQHGEIRMDRTESAYVYANAHAAAQAAQLAGDSGTAQRMQTTAARIRKAVLEVLWQDRSSTADSVGLSGDLLKHRQAKGPRLPVDWKETNNYYPFSVGLMPKHGDADDDPKYIRALRLFADAAQYPLFPFYTANQVDLHARGSGAEAGSNNFSTINATVAFRLLGAALRDYPSPYLSAHSYRTLLYWNAWATYINGDNRYPDQNEFWSKGSAANGGTIGYRSWIHHTQLGATNFSMIEDAMGLRPRSDNQIELYPIDIGWEHFAADNLRYRDRNLSIVWDRDGTHYAGQVPKGYSVYLDGRLAFRIDRLAHVLYDPASGQVTALPDAVNPAGAVQVLETHPAHLATMTQVAFAPASRAAQVLAKAGLDVTLPAAARLDLAHGAQATASFATPGFAAAAAVDGSTANTPFWGTAGSPAASDWLALRFAGSRQVDQVVLYFYRSSSPGGEQHGFPSGTRPGYAAPWMYVVQYQDGGSWKDVPGQVRDALIAEGNRNRVRFPPLRAQALRVVVTHAGSARTGIKELQVFNSSQAPPAFVGNVAPQVQAWQLDTPGADGTVRVNGRVGDDGLPSGALQVRWSLLQGPSGGEVVFADPAAVQTTVRFTQAGHYTLRLAANDGALAGHADVQVNAPASPPVERIALQSLATVSAQLTGTQYRVQALNDGVLPAADSTPNGSRRWGSYGRAQPQTVWLHYQWPRPVRLSSSTLYFWSDQPDGAVAPPASWTLQTLQDGRWQDVSARSGYPVAANGAVSTVSFAPIVTTGLRAVLTTQTLGTGRAAIGVDEWQAWSDVPRQLEPIDLRTAPGELPTLPQEVTAFYADGSVLPVAVQWPDVASERLASEGKVEVQGLVEGVVPIKATLWVRATPPGQITAVQPLPVVMAVVGQAPTLPGFVSLQYNDGSRERVPVHWPALAPARYAQPGEIPLTGTAQGRVPTGQVAVPLMLQIKAATP
ncbi:Ig-like domain-containing protein [Xanthomonas campestris pv. campestris]|uniref:Ig-like domain-containing protein n=1 Tax=Xanthomonas campestris TaxID=339 RepID=UPI001E2DF0F2|nr:Ig-like domain-containing protein [Xanthomonas campestris]MCD0252677.1 Ig-like domain-containing protein [Xanthomonas campestris pv. campestris]MEA0966841.1 Ig-like domain-containing protein [Xanthomonas campestris pv. campestris]MEA9559270.1 Ig-like domain-containing protein [Xanthomonas campestris]MEA9722182.1 Ig-like domain-containing protein [Xanthomonas campestris]MEA9807737.1 Ig-like domain-containing protein [Xanthomonas campestris pv. raphani]